jgi:DHA2 family methylenomycin A resistance protein-like MFS transporter
MAVLFALDTGADTLWVLLSGLVVAGIGLGLAHAGTLTGLLESVSHEQSGSASGIFSTSRYVGSIVGTSALPMLYGVADEMAGFMRVLSVIVMAALAATVASLWIQHRPSPD